jgi:hypothetical protein
MAQFNASQEIHFLANHQCVKKGVGPSWKFYALDGDLDSAARFL